MSHVEGVRKLVEMERGTREALEARLTQDISAIRATVDTISVSLRDSIDEYGHQLEKVSMELNESLGNYGRRYSKAQSDAELAAEAAKSRLVLLEDRCTSLEARLVEGQKRQGESLERVAQRSERVTASLEQARLDGGQQAQNMQTVLAMVREMEASIKASEAGAQEACERERRVREGEMRRLREVMNSEHERLRADIEGRISKSCERASLARDESTARFLSAMQERLTSATASRTASRSRLPVRPPEPPPTASGSLDSSVVVSVASPEAFLPAGQTVMERAAAARSLTRTTSMPLRRFHGSLVDGDAPALEETMVYPGAAAMQQAKEVAAGVEPPSLSAADQRQSAEELLSTCSALQSRLTNELQRASEAVLRRHSPRAAEGSASSRWD